ncbi:MAG: 2-amino-4-hydroxy-6-hydroxymethyldihydropteridine diphosphokinase [Candidatus Omnitrophica bacterium]|nr:2-amino-4-hydroxy-6-hydroxymethyldihydropteridine diphosphokinase [Candidatus Omnitrophota bacterium]MCM8816348.1 2-amino-4-hydroxy-6-hydroxymethyldihydropteridine diphosphokinase [Candidatus Omnitrophota bacterium]
MVEIFIGIGSNKGNRKNNISKAIELLTEKVELIKISKIYKTQPQEGVRGGWFLNGVIMGKTSLTPEMLLKFLQSIEQDLGRPANHKKNSERTIDLDILFYGNKIIEKHNLTIPHPRLDRREFVLKGLMEICPDFVHPNLKKSIKQIWQEFKDANSRKKIGNKRNSQKCS